MFILFPLLTIPFFIKSDNQCRFPVDSGTTRENIVRKKKKKFFQVLIVYYRQRLLVEFEIYTPTVIAIDLTFLFEFRERMSKTGSEI